MRRGSVSPAPGHGAADLVHGLAGDVAGALTALVDEAAHGLRLGLQLRGAVLDRLQLGAHRVDDGLLALDAADAGERQPSCTQLRTESSE
jgi:hypothetical protein